MTTAKIIQIDDNRLKLVSDPVVSIDQSLISLTETMFSTMDAAKGIGLAAIQIGEAKRLIVVNVRTSETDRFKLALANPEIVERSKETTSTEEGCLSIPGVRLAIERAQAVRVRYDDLKGQARELDADGLLAVCLQHEIDHLNGTLILDRVSRLRRDRAKSQFEKYRRLRN